MKKIIPYILSLAILFTCSFVVNAQEDTDVIEFTGRVKHYSQEGGFYGIEAKNWVVYRPDNLSESFQVHRLKVKGTARPIKNKVLTKGWGIPVHIITIERDE